MHAVEACALWGFAWDTAILLCGLTFEGQTDVVS